MMRSRRALALSVSLLLAALLLLAAGGLVAEKVQAQSRQPACVHNACVTNGLAYQYVLSRKSTFYAWYDTAYRLTGCGDSGWTTIGQFLLDVASEFLDAPGAYTMQCWQMMLGQASVCGDQCNQFFVKDCNYAPNVRATLDNAQPGYFTANVDNYDHSGGLPEYEPSAYSRAFSSYSYVQREGGQKLLFHKMDLPSLSYPTWVNDAALTECRQQYNDTRCTIIESFLRPSATNYDVSWGGGLYDLTGLTKNASGIDSQPSSGYIALKSDDDRITIDQGAYSGYVYVWEHNNETGENSESVSPWYAHGGDLTFQNSECNCYWCACNITQVSRDRDTYVFMTEGPADKLLTGDYTVQVEARLFHDKDLSDNTASYSYMLDAPPAPATPTPTSLPMVTPVVVDIVPGVYQGVIQANEIGDVYRYQIPAGVLQARSYLSMSADADFDLFGKPNQIPGHQDIYGDWCTICGDCWSASAAGQEEHCYVTYPKVGTNYLLVDRWEGTGPYTLRLEFITPTATPTATPLPPTATPPPTPGPGAGDTATPTATLPPGVTPTRTPVPPVTPGPAVSEQEPNDSFATANSWPVSSPMRGRIGQESDRDYYAITIPVPGIYTVQLSNVPAEIEPNLVIYRDDRYTVVSDYTAALGEPVTLTFDGNAGELFYVRVNGSSPSQTSDGQYTLSITGIPDPDEPNDSFAEATPWDFTGGPVEGYLWERTSGPADFYQFTVPASLDSVLLTVRLEQVPSNVAADLVVYDESHSTMESEYGASLGESISLTIDANPGEKYFVRVKSSSPSQNSDQPYRLRVTTVPDPTEPNDSFAQATAWNASAGPIQGYFWEMVSGPADYYLFTVPGSGGTVPVSVQVSDVAADVAPDLVVYNQSRTTVATKYDAGLGQSAGVTFNATGSATYYARVRSSLTSQVSDQPYTLSASFGSQAGSTTTAIATATPAPRPARPTPEGR